MCRYNRKYFSKYLTNHLFGIEDGTSANFNLSKNTIPVLDKKKHKTDKNPWLVIAFNAKI